MANTRRVESRLAHKIITRNCVFFVYYVTNVIAKNEKITTKDRIFNFLEVLLQCIKYQGFLIAVQVGYHYIICRFFSNFISSKTYRFFNFHIYFLDNNSIAHMLLELFGLNLYYFKSETDSPVIIDVGANIGDSIIYFKWLYPNAKIYAFEPLAVAYNMLEKNVKINNFKNVFAYNVALGNTEKTIQLFSDTKGTSRLSTINKSASKQNLKKDAKFQQIIIKKLSGYKKIMALKKVDLLKIDIEGAEGAVFDDLQSVLIKTEKVIVEYHMVPDVRDNSFDKIISVLKKFKFKPTFTGLYRNTDNEGNPIAFLIVATRH